MTEFIMLYLPRSKNEEFGAGCAEVIPKAYIGTPSGERQCKTAEGLALRRNRRFLLYSHSIVAGGLDEIS